MKKYAIAVISFDGYKDVWTSFFKIFYANWPNCPFKVYLINNSLHLPCANLINTGPETNWCDRAERALKMISEENIFLMLEDYFFGQTVDNQRVSALLDYYESNNCRYLRIINKPHQRHIKSRHGNFVPIYANEEYGINLQPAIWDKTYLLSVLSRISGTRSAWDFEITLLEEAQKSANELLNGCYTTTNNYLNIHNGILKGKWFPQEIKYFAKKNLPIEIGARPVLTIKEFWNYKIRCFIREHISYQSRKLIKHILIKFRVRFVTEI